MLRIVLILVMVGLFAVGAVLVFQQFRTTGGLVRSAQDVLPTIFETEKEPPILEPFQKETLITITESGFNPSELTTEPFVEVIWKNETSEPVSIEHFPEEGESKYNVFKISTIEPDGNASFDFYFRRRYRYRDRLHPERIGYVNVE